ERRAVLKRSRRHQPDNRRPFPRCALLRLGRLSVCSLRGDRELLDVRDGEELGDRHDDLVLHHPICLNSLECDVEPHLREPHHRGGRDGREGPSDEHDAWLTELVGIECTCVLKQPLPGRCLRHLASRLLGEELGVVADEVILGESRGHRRIFDRLHLHRLGCAVALELGDDESPGRVEAEHVETVELAVATCALPAVELERHDEDVRPEDLGPLQDPFLQVSTFTETGLAKRDWSCGRRCGALDGVDAFGRHDVKVTSARRPQPGHPRWRTITRWLESMTNTTLRWSTRTSKKSYRACAAVSPTRS